MDAVVERRCRHCDRPLPLTARPDRRYCSAAHRQAAYESRHAGERARGGRRSVAPVGSDPILADLQAAVERATEEKRLVAQIAAAARTWRVASERVAAGAEIRGTLGAPRSRDASARRDAAGRPVRGGRRTRATEAEATRWVLTRSALPFVVEPRNVVVLIRSRLVRSPRGRRRSSRRVAVR
jgi:hypothetical protein